MIQLRLFLSIITKGYCELSQRSIISLSSRKFFYRSPFFNFVKYLNHFMNWRLIAVSCSLFTSKHLTHLFGIHATVQNCCPDTKNLSFKLCFPSASGKHSFLVIIFVYFHFIFDLFFNFNLITDDFSDVIRLELASFHLVFNSTLTPFPSICYWNQISSRNFRIRLEIRIEIVVLKFVSLFKCQIIAVHDRCVVGLINWCEIVVTFMCLCVDSPKRK